MKLGWNNTLSVREPLIALVSLILIGGFLITNVSSYYVSKNSLREAIIDNELPLTSNNIYSEIQRDLLRPVFVSSLMANDTLVKDWLVDGEQDLEKITRYLAEIRRNYNVFTSFLVSERTGNYYHFTGLSQVVSEEDPRDAWYFRVRDMPEPFELNVDFNAEQGDTLTIFINHKVEGYDGKLIAVVGVGLKFGTVANIVGRYKENYGRHIYFVNDDGDILVRSEGAPVAEDNIRSAAGISAVAPAILEVDQGFFEYERDGESMLVSSRHIPELGWRVIVEQQESEALASIRESLIINTLVGLVVIAMTILIVSYTVNRFHSRLETMASRDKLTGVGNRSMFDLTLEQALQRYRRDELTFSVILMDIDHFKRINDTLGHLEGDRVIQNVVQVIREAMRESDVLCRWGGDELIVLAHNCSLENAVQLAEKTRKSIETASFAVYLDGEPATLSGGVTEVRAGDNADDLIRRADEALYQAKQEGRNCIRPV
ncbi:sensor domain-containing diguanylate cyclase [Motiliproteus sp. MSK22-1]|uniref:sensor domain-containing diguanylate cyclase n=1 Tax=Motiliproteus sp. MSK22-1 TaxID=1897630 RepID=UPI0009757E44|nr:sensor domain-containing diguanylate cyclase [Motiliproteus sp. MSK22-1]OMH26597.1 hypothetical protein BGP75_23145 [Motiliproteus sp. MSK22-1]